MHIAHECIQTATDKFGRLLLLRTEIGARSPLEAYPRFPRFCSGGAKLPSRHSSRSKFPSIFQLIPSNTRQHPPSPTQPRLSSSRCRPLGHRHRSATITDRLSRSSCDSSQSILISLVRFWLRRRSRAVY